MTDTSPSAEGAPGLPRLRSALTTFPPYIPGKPPAEVPGLTPYKLSSNENHLPPPPAVLETMAAHAVAPAAYPDDAAAAARRELADRLGVGTDNLVVTTGASELLVALTQITSDATTEAIYPWPSFEMYPQTTGLAGSTRIEVPPRSDGTHDLAAMAAAITEATSLIILCSPNNPTGPVLRDAEVRELLTAVPDHVVVALDEAYWEFANTPGAVDGLELVADHPNVVLLRTFSKAHGLAGARRLRSRPSERHRRPPQGRHPLRRHRPQPGRGARVAAPLGRGHRPRKADRHDPRRIRRGPAHPGLGGPRGSGQLRLVAARAALRRLRGRLRRRRDRRAQPRRRGAHQHRPARGPRPGP